MVKMNHNFEQPKSGPSFFQRQTVEIRVKCLLFFRLKFRQKVYLSAESRKLSDVSICVRQIPTHPVCFLKMKNDHFAPPPLQKQLLKIESLNSAVLPPS
jgi:hypothetical protein